MADDMEYSMSSPQREATPPDPSNRWLPKWTAPMLRILVDYVEEEKGSDSTFLTDRAAACDEVISRMKVSCPAHEYVTRTRDQVSAKLCQLATSNSERDTTVKKLLTYGRSVIILSKVLKGVFSEEEIQADNNRRETIRTARNAKTNQTRKRSNHQVVEPGKVQSRKTENDSRDPSVASDFSQVTALEDVVVCAGPPDKAAIGETMTDIANKIESCVSARLTGAGISAHRATFFNFEAYGDWLCELLESVGGCDHARLQERYMQIMNMQSQQRLDVATFLRSVVGAAVTLWAIQPSPLNETSGAMYEDLVSEWQLVAPVAARAVQKRALRKHLETRVLPAVPEKARLMANKLNHVLMPFLTPPMNKPSSMVVDDVAAVQNEHADGMEGSDDNVFDASTPRFVSPPWVLNWQSELQEIFCQALQLRVDMELMSGNYTLVFPSAGSRFKTKTMVDKKTRLSGVKLEDSIVMVGLLPIIYARSRSSEGLQGQRDVVSPGQVVCFAP